MNTTDKRPVIRVLNWKIMTVVVLVSLCISAGLIALTSADELEVDDLHSEGCVPIEAAITGLVANRLFPKMALTGQVYDESWDQLQESFMLAVNHDTGEWRILEVDDEVSCTIAGGFGVQLILLRNDNEHR